VCVTIVVWFMCVSRYAIISVTVSVANVNVRSIQATKARHVKIVRYIVAFFRLLEAVVLSLL